MALRGFAGITRAQAAALLSPGYPAGRFSFMAARPVQAGTPVDSFLRFYPHPIFEPIRCTSIFAQTVVAGTTSAVKCAVWANDRASARPTGLPLVGQNVGFATTATGQHTATFSEVLLPPGWYWFGSIGTGGAAPQMLCNAGTDITQQYLRANVVGSFATVATAFTYASDILAFDATLAPWTQTNGGIPAIGLGWA